MEEVTYILNQYIISYISIITVQIDTRSAIHVHLTDPISMLRFTVLVPQKTLYENFYCQNFPDLR